MRWVVGAMLGVVIAIGLTGLPGWGEVVAQSTICSSFSSQAAAQAAYRANPSGLSNLDADGDGIACEGNPRPCDFVRVMPLGGFREEASVAASSACAGTAITVPAPQPSVPAPAPAPPRAPSLEEVPLRQGCNNVVLTWPGGTALTVVAAAISPGASLLSIFRSDLAQGRFLGFNPSAPNFANDYTTTASSLEPVFICMSTAGTLMRPVR